METETHTEYTAHKYAQKIEAILFYTALAVEKETLSKILEVSLEIIESALDELETALTERGVVLVRNGSQVLLATAPSCSDSIEKMIKIERTSTLGRAGMETLSIVAYKGPVSKKEIEFIRGVNSDYAIRTLLLRGLIEKNVDTDGESLDRITKYRITADTLLHLGITKIFELPEYSKVQQELYSAEETQPEIMEDVINTDGAEEENIEIDNTNTQ